MMNRIFWLTCLMATIAIGNWAGRASAQSGSRGYPPPSSRSNRSIPNVNRPPQGSAPRPLPPTNRVEPGSAPRTAPARPAPAVADKNVELGDRFWAYLKRVQYQNWGPLPGMPAEAYAGSSPHGAQVKLYANRIAAGQSDKLPVGSILVKENFDEAGQQLMAITAMYRQQGFAPNDGDWFWVKFEPNGRVSTMGKMAVAGRVNMCVECHSAAENGDYVFANDRN